jgi:uncharacterized RDD family membrane protein YckC
MDDYIISTPEMVDISYDVARLGTRFQAFAIDSLIQAAVMLLLNLAANLGLASVDYAASDWYAALVLLFIALIAYGYFLFFEIALKGQTPGKKLMKLRVVRKDGRPADLSSLLVRNLLRVIDSLPVFYTAGVLCMFVSRDSRRIGDLAAGTIVVFERRRAELHTILAGRGETPRRVYERLSNEEYAMIRDFLTRREQLTDAARKKLAQQLASALCARHPDFTSPSGDPELFLLGFYRD